MRKTAPDLIKALCEEFYYYQEQIQKKEKKMMGLNLRNYIKSIKMLIVLGMLSLKFHYRKCGCSISFNVLH